MARFAQNDEFQVRTLLDPGATINIISPMVANRSAIQRKQLAVNIFQGKRKQASVEEMVKCQFELMSANGTWVKHVEWFAVCDLGYDCLLGRRFCRVQGLTSFDDKLKNFDVLPPKLHRLNVSSLSVMQQRIMFRFVRVDAPLGDARNKRRAKAVLGIANCDKTSIGNSLLTAINELSSLKILARRREESDDQVLLLFSVDTIDGKRTELMEEWFSVVVVEAW